MRDREEMLALAFAARKNAYAPYSGFAVGAALEAGSGKVYLGINIENAAYSVTNCAERTALFAAVAAGEREFSQIAVVGGKRGEAADEICAPCGVCRQALNEFCGADFLIHMGTQSGERKTCTLSELLPLAFGKDNL